MKNKLALLIVIFGIAISGNAWADSDYRGADAGFLLASIGYTRPVLDSYAISYRGTPFEPIASYQREMRVSTCLFGKCHDFDDGTLQSDVIVHRLRPGTYIFNGAIANEEYLPNEAFFYVFTIKPGETTYFGSFIGSMAISPHEKDLFGNPLFLGAQLSVEDQHERDFAFAQKKRPTLPPISAIMLPKMTGPMPMEKRIQKYTIYDPGG